MRGDFSRIRFNRLKGYTAVMDQQGRVALDADCQRAVLHQRLPARRRDSRRDRPVRGADAVTPVSRSRSQTARSRSARGATTSTGCCARTAPRLSYDSQPYLLGIPAEPSTARQAPRSAGKGGDPDLPRGVATIRDRCSTIRVCASRRSARRTRRRGCRPCGAWSRSWRRRGRDPRHRPAGRAKSLLPGDVQRLRCRAPER